MVCIGDSVEKVSSSDEDNDGGEGGAPSENQL